MSHKPIHCHVVVVVAIIHQSLVVPLSVVFSSIRSVPEMKISTTVYRWGWWCWWWKVANRRPSGMDEGFVSMVLYLRTHWVNSIWVRGIWMYQSYRMFAYDCLPVIPTSPATSLLKMADNNNCNKLINTFTMARNGYAKGASSGHQTTVRDVKPKAARRKGVS